MKAVTRFAWLLWKIPKASALEKIRVEVLLGSPLPSSGANP